jgi:hypothetical protein
MRGGGILSMMVSSSGISVVLSSPRSVVGLALAGAGVEQRELELLVVGAKIDEQVVDFIEHGGDPGVRAVDLVDAHGDVQARLHRLAQHEAGLRERALGGVDQQDRALDHREHALDLAAEVGVARGVEDVDLVVAVEHGRVLAGDGDAALALEVHRVHHPVGRWTREREGVALTQQPVDQAWSCRGRRGR